MLKSNDIDQLVYAAFDEVKAIIARLSPEFWLTIEEDAKNSPIAAVEFICEFAKDCYAMGFRFSDTSARGIVDAVKSYFDSDTSDELMEDIEPVLAQLTKGHKASSFIPRA